MLQKQCVIRETKLYDNYICNDNCGDIGKVNKC